MRHEIASPTQKRIDNDWRNRGRRGQRCFLVYPLPHDSVHAAARHGSGASGVSDTPRQRGAGRGSVRGARGCAGGGAAGDPDNCTGGGGGSGNSHDGACNASQCGNDAGFHGCEDCVARERSSEHAGGSGACER